MKNVLGLDRNLNGKFEFLHCGSCGRPILGHWAEKCRMKEGNRYTNAVIKAMEDRIRTIEGFRQIVKKHIQIEQEI